MLCISRYLVGAVLLSAALALIVSSGVAQAQGSAGGSIGNDDKSLSGTRQTPRAVTRARKPEAEAPRRAVRKSGGEGGGGGGGGNFDGSWVVVAVGTPCGSSTERLVISGGRIAGELSTGVVSPNGSTTGGGSASGVSWTSSGHFSARSGSGSFVRSDGCTGRWNASRQ